MDVRSDHRGSECRQVRERLCERGAATGTASRADSDHLLSCPRCAAFARRLTLARQLLAPAEPLSPAILPDAGFAARVLSRIARPSDLLGWAAFRALPAAVGLALALAWFGFTLPAAAPSPAAAPPPPPASELLGETAPSADQLIAWSAASPEVWP
jgi:hypothetical protein